MVKKEVDQGLLRMATLVDERIMRKFFIIYHEEKYVSNTLRAFLNVASEFSSDFALFA